MAASSASQACSSQCSTFCIGIRGVRHKGPAARYIALHSHSAQSCDGPGRTYWGASTHRRACFSGAIPASPTRRSAPAPPPALPARLPSRAGLLGHLPRPSLPIDSGYGPRASVARQPFLVGQARYLRTSIPPTFVRRMGRFDQGQKSTSCAWVCATSPSAIIGEHKQVQRHSRSGTNRPRSCPTTQAIAASIRSPACKPPISDRRIMTLVKFHSGFSPCRVSFPFPHAVGHTLSFQPPEKRL